MDSNVITQFIAYLGSLKYSASTIISNISAVSFIHKLNDWVDPGDSFVVKKMLNGAKNIQGSLDVRLPISLKILEKLILLVNSLVDSHYVQAAIQSMFSLAFYALLRLSELCTKGSSKSKSEKILQLSDICFHKTDNSTVLLVTIRHFKHNKSLRPVTLELKKQSSLSCPVKLMKAFLKLRDKNQGVLFIFRDGNPITTSFFMKTFKKALKLAGLSEKFYKGHSFRIGGATTAAAKGYSDAQIQTMGRWKSGAFKKYIRIPTISIT